MIAIENTWEQWGKLALRQTRMKLQLANGHIQRPIGLLEIVLVTTCGIKYEHTFVVVDFGQNPKYDVILGQLFMRQLKMIQDWGFNYIYLWQESSTRQIYMRDHSFRDIAKTLKQAPSVQGKQEYIKLVKANGCKKNKCTKCYRTKLIIDTKEKQTQKVKTQISKREKKQEMTKLER